MRETIKQKTENYNFLPWLWGGSIGLGIMLAGLGLFVVLYPNNSAPPSSPVSKSRVETEPTTYDPQPIEVDPILVAIATPELSREDLPLTSVEEACGFDQFAPYHSHTLNEMHWPFSPWDENDELAAFFTESEACRKALDRHVGTINPYLWGAPPEKNAAFGFFVLDNPLTFERIFADPDGDFKRVQDALDRPECLIQHDFGSKWELNESCHADALTNFALINRYCFHNGVEDRPRTSYFYRENVSSEHDWFMWKQELEGAWIDKKCKELSSDLQLTTNRYSELIKVLVTVDNPMRLKGWVGSMIELAARLGDDAAGLTMGYAPSRMIVYVEHGVEYGRYRTFLNNPDWNELRWKSEPNKDRFLNIFQFLAVVTQSQTKFDWEWVVQHLCTPPYYPSHSSLDDVVDEQVYSGQFEEPQSCRDVVSELYIEELITGPVLEMVVQFEHTALELGLYE